MALLRKLFWLAIFLISTLCFVVLFEKGTVDFTKNLSKQIEEFQGFVSEQISPKKDPAP